MFKKIIKFIKLTQDWPNNCKNFQYLKVKEVITTKAIEVKEEKNVMNYFLPINLKISMKDIFIGKYNQIWVKGKKKEKESPLTIIAIKMEVKIFPPRKFKASSFTEQLH